MRTLIILFIVLGCCIASAYMTIDTLRKNDDAVWQIERWRERALFAEVKYRVLMRKYMEQEKLLNNCQEPRRN
jgi:hypothetical protein